MSRRRPSGSNRRDEPQRSRRGVIVEKSNPERHAAAWSRSAPSRRMAVSVEREQALSRAAAFVDSFANLLDGENGRVDPVFVLGFLSTVPFRLNDL